MYTTGINLVEIKSVVDNALTVVSQLCCPPFCTQRPASILFSLTVPTICDGKISYAFHYCLDYS